MWRLFSGSPPDDVMPASMMDLPDVEALDELFQLEAEKVTSQLGRNQPVRYQEGFVDSKGQHYVLMTLSFDDNTPDQEIWFRYGDATRPKPITDKRVWLGALTVGGILIGLGVLAAAVMDKE